jgi:hypothetical protein
MSAAVVEQIDHSNQFVDRLSDVVRMTEALFSGQASAEVMSDPESPSESWVVVSVQATGEPKQLVKLRCEWHERLARQFPECVREFRLSIVPPA